MRVRGVNQCASPRTTPASVDAKPWNNVRIDFQLLAATTVFRRLKGERMVGYILAMTEPNAIEAASKRLALALDALAAAVERRQVADREEATLAAQLHALGNDRSRLASELDDATARARSLESANREVAQRLDSAIGTLRSLLVAAER
jgi:hypothetical protein